MFNSLEIKNFQSHKNTRLEFTPGVNVIVGTSDSGKSAIFRALKWLMYNRPLGDSFCSHWADGEETKVALQLDNCFIVRSREKNKQLYSVNGLDLTAFKTDVPEEVSKALNIDQVNFEQQFDRPFLLDNSPGEVAQYFSKIAHLEMIDKSLKTLHQQERANNQELKSLESRKESTEQALEAYIDLDELDKKLALYERMEKNLIKMEETISDLGLVISKVHEVELELVNEKQIDTVLATTNTCLELATVCYNLDSSLSKISQLNEQLQDEQRVNTAINIINEMTKIAGEYLFTQSYCKSLRLSINAIVDTEKGITGLEESICKSEAILKESMPAVCPLCGHKIAKEM